jgi:PAS domain-containing protein
MGQSQEPERIIAEFFNNSDVGLATIDRQLRYRMINPYLARSNGAPVESHLGKHLEQILGDVGLKLGPSCRESIFS